MKQLFILFLFINFLFANENNIVKYKNALLVDKLIKQEEKIALACEKYILNELEIPTIDDLTDLNYLGNNFSKKNTFGDEITFKDNKKLYLQYAITKKAEKYINDLYKRDLHRSRTFVVHNENLDQSYIEITLEDKRAKKLYLLLQDYSIDKTCNDINTKNKFCNHNQDSLRFYDENSNWIEFDKDRLFDGNVTVNNELILKKENFINLKVGSYIYLENTAKYIKFPDGRIGKVE